MLFCPTQNIYILHEFKGGGGGPIWFLVHMKLKNSATHLIFNYNIKRPYQTTYYFAQHNIFTSYMSLRWDPYLVPGPYQAKT